MQPQQPYYGQPPQQGYGYQTHPGFPPAAPIGSSWQQQPAPVAVAGPPQFSDPTGGSGGGMPLKLREILGRACGVKPVKLIPATPGKMFNGKPETDGIVMDILILDGPLPLQFGESRATDGTGGPAVYQFDTLPALVTGVISNNQEIVKECRRVLEQNPGNVIPCRIVRGTQGNNPFLLAALGGVSDPQPQLADQARAQLAAAYTAIAMGQFVNPEPREINGGPRQKATNNGAAPQQAQYPPQPAYQPQPMGQVVYPQQSAAANPAFMAAGTAPYQQATAIPPAPPGWDPNVWAGLSDADKARFLPQQ